MAKATKDKCKFEVSVEYLAEYTGVQAALICDREGLVVSAKACEPFDFEAYAAMAKAMVEVLGDTLTSCVDSSIEHVSVRTDDDWVTIAKSSGLYLVVVAANSTDDLLNVRVSRALEMISVHMKDRYPALALKTDMAGTSQKRREAVNV